MGIGSFDRARFPDHSDCAASAPSLSSPVLLTHRLRLRPILTDDAAALFGVFGDPETMRFWDAPPRRTVAETAQMIRGYLAPAPPRCLNWAVTYRDEAYAVGVVWLTLVDAASRWAEVKFVLGRNHWRQGLMSEALHRVLDHVFVDLALNRIQACLHSDDDRSAKLLHRLSFHREGTLRQSLFVHNRYRDIDLHSLLARDWLDRSATYRIAKECDANDTRPEAPDVAERA